jgi:hypothetical protein
MRSAAISFVAAAIVVGVSLVAAPAANAQAPKEVIVVNAPAAPVPVTVQGSPSVLIGNPSVPTIALDNPAVQPFQRFLVGEMADGEFNMGDELAVTVPAGKRLVIELASAIVTTAAGQNVRIRVDATAGGGAGAHHLTVAEEPWQGVIDHKGIQLTRMYADPGSTVYIRVARDQGAGVASVNASISGYLVNVF